MKTTIQLIALSVLLAACNRTLPCDDCEEVEAAAEEQADSDPIPDLPCGGADLMTDDENCGECGHECPINLVDTEWEAGGCQGGVCQPTWGSCSSGWQTCSEYCSLANFECVEGGCAGASGLRITVPAQDGCLPESHAKSPIESCDTVIDYESDDPLFFIDSVCCCAFPGG